MSKVKVVAISDLKTEKVRIDGKPSREYLTLQFSTNNPLIPVVTRNFWQNHVSNNDGTFRVEWRLGATPEAIAQMKGMTLDGSIVCRKVKPYEIPNGTDTPTIAQSYTTVVFDEEDVARVFRQSGRMLAEEWEAQQQAEVVNNFSAMAAIEMVS